MVHNLVDDLVARIGALLRLARNFSQKTADGVVIRNAAPGSSVLIEDWNLRGAGIPAVYDVNPATGYTAGDITRKPQRSVTLPSTIKAISVALTPAEYRMLIADNVKGIDGYSEFQKRLREAIVDKFAQAFVDRFLAVIATHTFFTFETALTTFTRQFELTVEKKLFDRKLASKNNATIIVDSQGWLDYTLDHTAVQNATGQRIEGAVSDLRASLNTPFSIGRTNATLTTKIAKGFAYCEPAAFFVARLPDEPTFEGDPVGLQEVVHDEVELPMLFRVWKDPKTAVLQFDAATIFEFYANQAEAVERFVAPA
ncbi:MAG: hypothetical protein JNJ83_10995 [Verrucomicrobiaceae bacterium]|nr:hypothetical protein [Verrucomicrobiaceae bacterium]